MSLQFIKALQYFIMIREATAQLPKSETELLIFFKQAELASITGQRILNERSNEDENKMTK